MQSTCRLCNGQNIQLLYDFGEKPIAHRLLDRPGEAEDFFPYALHSCRDCGLVQLMDPIDPELLYKSYNYNFTSWKPEPHRPRELELIASMGPFKSVAEIGCNDGSFLADLKELGISSPIGIEPNPVSSAIAKSRGLTVYNEMATTDLCKQIVEQHGQVDLVTSRQVIEHVLSLEEFFACIEILLKDDGILFLDMPDSQHGFSLPDCSVFWEEHVTYFTEPVVQYMLSYFGYEPITTEIYDFSGGTVAVAARRKSQTDQSRPVRVTENAIINTAEFSDKVQNYQSRIKSALADAQKDGAEIVLYGTGARACNLMNGLALGEFIDFAIDDQLERQGKFMPGCHLEIRSPDTLIGNDGALILLLAVNNENEEKVKGRIADLVQRQIRYVSLLGPKNIWDELDQLAS
mgnify:CR=1 FL=1|jgi:2-polyprenyl-3-methyl-5-hydroxy-6-metoxy-1,4-benzoquinol methylase